MLFRSLLKSTKVKIGSYYYFFRSNAKMATNQFCTISGKYYYVGSDGTVRTTAGFINIGSKRYYINSGGTVVWDDYFTYNGTYYFGSSSGTISSANRLSAFMTTALSQVGNSGGRPYWSWYGFSRRVEWCACYVSWCANKAGMISSGRMPKFSLVSTGADWYKSKGLWVSRGNTPQPGYIIFFDWDHNGTRDHVGIVYACSGGTVYTVEGNSSDAVRKRSYSVNSSYILGYGTPRY